MVSLVLSGGIACILAYGQTGTGKTYTMSALELEVARELFSEAEKRSADLLGASKYFNISFSNEQLTPSPQRSLIRSLYTKLMYLFLK